MKSHADEIYSGDGVDLEGDYSRMWHYARGLEFALECIGKGMKLNSDFTCAFCDSKKPHIHTAGDEAKLAVKEEKFSGHLYGPTNPCGKPFCVACYPSLKSEEVKSDGPC